MKILLAVTEDNYPLVIEPNVEAKIMALGDVVQRKDLPNKAAEGYDPDEAYTRAIAETQPEIIITGWGHWRGEALALVSKAVA